MNTQSSTEKGFFYHENDDSIAASLGLTEERWDELAFKSREIEHDIYKPRREGEKVRSVFFCLVI